MRSLRAARMPLGSLLVSEVVDGGIAEGSPPMGAAAGCVVVMLLLGSVVLGVVAPGLVVVDEGGYSVVPEGAGCSVVVPPLDGVVPASDCASTTPPKAMTQAVPIAALRGVIRMAMEVSD